MNEVFFTSLVNLYITSPPEKQKIIVKELSHCGKNDEFINFLEKYTKAKNFKAETIFELLIDYGLEASRSFSKETLTLFVNFFIKYLSKLPNPSSFTKFAQLLVKIFTNYKIDNEEEMFSTLKSLPSDIGILPLAYFSVQHHSYLQSVFDIATSSPDKLVDNPAAVLWCHSIATLFHNASNLVEYDPVNIYSCAELAMSYPSIPIAQRFSLLSASLDFLDSVSCNQLIAAHYGKLVSNLNPSNTAYELAVALDSSRHVLDFFNKQNMKDKTLIYDCVFNKILVYYRPCKTLNEAIERFCRSLEKIELKALLNPFITADINQNASMFIISRFPDDEFLPYLLGDGTKSLMQFQYDSILFFLTHHTIPSNYIPHIFKIVNVIDMPILDIVLEKRPRMYCTAAAQYLSTSNDFAKIEYIAQALSKKACLPYIKSKSLTTAFMNVAIHTLQGEKAHRGFAVLMEYIFSCSSRDIEEEEQETRVQLTSDYTKHNPAKQNTESNTTNEEVNTQTNTTNEEVNTQTNTTNEEVNTQNDTTDEEVNAQTNASNKEETRQEDKQHNKTTEKKVGFSEKRGKGIGMVRDASSSALFQVPDENNLDEGDFFKVSDVKFNVTSPAKLVNGICMKRIDWGTNIINLALNEIRNGNPSFCILIASISGDIKLLRQCINILDQIPSLLIHFFTVSSCVSPTAAIKLMQEYITPPKQETSFLNFFSQPQPINEVKIETVLHSLISMAPFVTITDDLINMLVFAFANIDSSNKQRALFSFEAVRAICSNSKEKFHLAELLNLMTKQKNSCDKKTFIDALIPALNMTTAVDQKLSNTISDIWISFLISGLELDMNCTFESTFLSERLRQVTLIPYLTHLERAFLKKQDCLPLFMSLARIIRMSSIDPCYLQRYMTLCIANTLSDNLKIREFCVSVLRTTQKLEETIPNISFGDYTMDTVEVTRPFFTELSQKLKGKYRVLLLEALLQHFEKCQQKGKITILMFADCLVSGSKELFIESKKNFVELFINLSKKVESNSSCISIISQILYAMQSANPELFMKQFIELPECKTGNLFLARFYGDQKFSQSFTQCIFKEVENYIPSNKESDKFLRIISYIEKHVIKTIFLYSSEELLAETLFVLLIIFSQLYEYRKTKYFFSDTILTTVESIMSQFYQNTTITICLPPIDFTTDEKYSQSIANMVQNFARLPGNTVHIYLKKVYKLANTHHATTAGIVFSHIIAAFSTVYSENGKHLLGEYFSIFFTFLKDAKTSDPMIISSLISAISLFTKSSFAVLDYIQVSKIISITCDIADNCPAKCLYVLDMITDIGSPQIMDMQNGAIISCLRAAFQAGCDEELAMKILLKTVKARHQPEWFLKETSICYSTLTERIIKNNDNVVENILMILLDSTEKEFNAKEIYKKIMSLFAAVDHNVSNYIKIANKACKVIDPTRATKRQVELISAVVLPLASVKDQDTSATIETFTKFITNVMTKNTDSHTLPASIRALSEIAEKKSSLNV